MEKRLFLAIFLSLIVVFGFQALFSPKNIPSKETQTVEINAFRVEGEKPADVSSPVLPVAVEKTAPQFPEKTISIENNDLFVNVTNKGGNIESIRLKQHDYLVPVKGLLNFDVLEAGQFDIERISDEKLRLIHQGSGLRVVKEISLNANYTITAQITIKNISGAPKPFSGKRTNFVVDTSRLDTHNVQSDYMLYEYSIKTDKRIIRKDNARAYTDKWNKEESATVEWAAFRDKYFVTIVQPNVADQNYIIKSLSDKELFMGASILPRLIDAGQEISYEYKIFAGPQRLDLLSRAGASFDKVMVFSNWGWLDAISKAIYWLLGAIHKIIPVWGLCIIIISLIVYGLMYPLTAKSLVSMKKLQTLQPKMKELQEKYKGNPERLNKEIVELYRVHQVNPLSGCLPMLLQMPIFVGLYQVLWRSVYFKGQSFLWMKDLSLPDRTLKLPVSIPFLGEYLNILPVIMVAVMAIQQNLNMKTMVTGSAEQAAQQKIMAIFFPILIGFIFYNMASGLNLYFVVFYVLSTLSQWHIAHNTQTGH